MKATQNLLILSFITIFFSCTPSKRKEINKNIIEDTLQTKTGSNEQSYLETRNQVEEREFADSVRLEQVLTEAILKANQNITLDKFTEKYDGSPDSVSVDVEISLDYYFTKAQPHLIIRRNDHVTNCIDIYSKGAQKFEKVLSHKQWALEYINDTIRDINGNGLKDFVVNWYGVNGCCLKAFSNIYLLRSDKKSFSNNFEFINPTFSPKEQLIRGVCYGHPGETEMYKYKWNGEKVDTLEYVSNQKNDKGVKTGKIILSSNQLFRKNFKILSILKNPPAEYRKIEGYDWFTGNGYN